MFPGEGGPGQDPEAEDPDWLWRQWISSPNIHQARAGSSNGFHRDYPAPQPPGIYLIQHHCPHLTIFLQGFGAGNFKALFECIELDQATRGNL